MKTAACATNIGLIGVNGKAPTSETASMKTFQLTSSAVLTVEQKQAGSPPVSGTFSLSYEDKIIEGNLKAYCFPSCIALNHP